MERTPKILVVGNGRFGAYFSAHLQDVGLDVNVIDIATERNVIELHYAEADVIIFAVPIRHLRDVATEAAEFIKKGALVLDVCSVKCLPCTWLNSIFKHLPVSVVGTHPLFGPQSAPGDKIRGQKIAVCFIKGDANPALEIFSKLGLVTVLVSPEDHDRQMCTQLIDHLVGRAAKAAEIGRVDLSTKTHELFMDVVDVVNGNSVDLFHDMNTFNPFAVEARRTFIQQLAFLHMSLNKLDEIRHEEDEQ